MKIRTKFKVGDKAFVIANSVIKKVEIKKINIEVHSDNRKEITYTLARGSKHYIEKQLGITPQEAVDRLLSAYRAMNPEDFEYENEEQGNAVNRNAADRASALEIDDPDAEEDDEEEESPADDFLRDYEDDMRGDEEDEEDDEDSWGGDEHEEIPF